MTAGRRVCVARIGAPHGVRGDVRLSVFTEAPEALAGLGPFEDDAGTRRFVLEALRRQGDGFVARFAGVADRTAAQGLTNLRLHVPRERLPAVADEDTFYHADLIGLAAETAAGERLGTVTAVHDFGAGDILEIAPVEGGQTRMMPFTRAVVPQVDVAGGRLVVAPPAETEGEPR